jgi:hypothetical protein
LEITAKQITEITQLITQLLQTNDIITPNIKQLIVTGITNIIQPNGKDIPSQQAMNAFTAQLTAGFPDIQETILTNIKTQFLPSSDNPNYQSMSKTIEFLTKHSIAIGLPIVVTELNKITNASSYDKSITNLKRELDGGLTCIQTNLLNEINTCNIKNAYTGLVNANINPCP